MSASGRGWVWMSAMGCRDTGGHKNKTRSDINGCAGHDLDPYGRGNFPGHYVLQKKQKNMHGALRMGVHVLAWVRVEAWIRRKAKTRQKGNK